MMMKRSAICATAVFVLTASCHIASKAGALSLRAAAEQAPVRAYDASNLFVDLVEPAPAGKGGSWDIKAPEGLRPCCALGANMGVALGPVPIPILKFDNVADPKRLGRHRYNSGLLSFAADPEVGVGFREQNGILYTCGGGFVDTAHIRDYADLMVYLYKAIEPDIDKGADLTLPAEAGDRIIHLKPASPALLRQRGHQRLALDMAAWLTFQLSIWHELASWYGWSHIPLFPETVSAFSPEDLYTNVLGIRLATELIRAGRTETEEDYESAMDETVPRLLARLGVMPAPLSHAVVASVDGAWWNSSERLPHFELVKYRNFQIGPQMLPQRVPASMLERRFGPKVGEYCAAWDDHPIVLEVPSGEGSTPFQEMVTLEVHAPDQLASVFPFPRKGDFSVTQNDFPDLVAGLVRSYGDGLTDKTRILN